MAIYSIAKVTKSGRVWALLKRFSRTTDDVAHVEYDLLEPVEGFERTTFVKATAKLLELKAAEKRASGVISRG